MSSMDENQRGAGKEVPIRAVLWFVIIFIVFGLIAHAGLWTMYRLLVLRAAREDVSPSALVGDRPPPPEPRLQPSLAHNTFPRQDLAEVRRVEDEEFTRRGWRSERGEIQIPEPIVNQVAALSATQPAGGSK